MQIPPIAAPARGLMAAAALVLAAGCAQQPGTPRPPVEVAAGIVSVTHADPAGFSEARGAPHESGKARRAWLDALSQHLSERAAAALPRGQRLEIHIADVQRAGGFEPWRGLRAAGVRVVRDIYPPRIDLSFKLRDERGAVLREGSRQLRDSAFLMRPDMYPNDPLRHEKALLDDWVRKEFGGAGARYTEAMLTAAPPRSALRYTSCAHNGCGALSCNTRSTTVRGTLARNPASPRCRDASLMLPPSRGCPTAPLRSTPAPVPGR